MTVFHSAPELWNLLLNTPAGTIKLGASTGASRNSEEVDITVNSTWLPGGSAQVSMTRFAVMLAHELGHFDDPNGIKSVVQAPLLENAENTGLSTTGAVQIGLNCEGVALMYEFVVAQELHTGMHTTVGPAYLASMATFMQSANVNPEGRIVDRQLDG